MKGVVQLTLGAHAKRGLRYLVRVLSLCVCLHSFSNYIQATRQLTSDTTKAQKGLKNNAADFARSTSYSVKNQANKPIC